MIKKLLFTVLALAIAIGVGIGVFYWTGGDSSELRRKGDHVRKQIKKAGRRGSQAVNNTREVIPQPTPPKKKKPPEASNRPVPSAERPVSPPGPPMEEIDEKDRKKLEELLQETQ